MKSALIMGASGDIGAALVKKLAQEGWSLYCHYHSNREKVLKIVEDLRNEYPQQDFFMVCLDMLTESRIPRFLDTLFQVDAVVFASGFTYYELLTEVTGAQMDDLWRIHLKTPMLLCQQLQKKLTQSKHGRIVFVGSVYGAMGSSMETIYSAVKGGQTAFAKAYAKEIASLGITVNVVAPGAVATAMNQNWTEAELAELRQSIPLGRLAQAEEVAASVQFLLSDEADYITGATLPVNGGWY